MVIFVCGNDQSNNPGTLAMEAGGLFFDHGGIGAQVLAAVITHISSPVSDPYGLIKIKRRNPSEFHADRSCGFVGLPPWKNTKPLSVDTGEVH